MRKRKKGRLWSVFVILLAFAVVYMLANNKNIGQSGPISATDQVVKSGNIANDDYGWNLILVNRQYHMPENYTVELTELSNGESVDSRIYPDLQEMFDTARAEGVYLFVGDGYRTWETQQRLLDEKIEAYQKEGYSDEEAEQKAKQWVAVPGTSEHQLGLAVDINADTSQSSSDEVYGWLADNAYKFGFINRYPEGKTEITGTIYEPWHYRYVGKEAAQEIYSQEICLEEYIEQLQKKEGDN